jgi:hypothetical protein
MAQTEDFVTGNTGMQNHDLDDNASGRNSKEIRSEIDRTRSSMDETFAALDAKMTPKEIGLEMWNLFKGGSSTGLTKLWQVTREHPMPAAVIGLGLGWLMVESSRKSDEGYDGLDRGTYRGNYRAGSRGDYRGDYRGYGSSSYRQGYAGTGGYSGFDADADDEGMLASAKDKVGDLASGAKDAFSSATDKVSDAADWTKEHASDLGHQVADKASSLGHQVADTASSLGHQAKDRAVALKYQAKRQARSAKLGFWQTMEENPFVIGAATLALGVIAGLLVPSTDKEDELMGETRDHLFDEVKEAGQQALDKGKHVADAIVDKVKEEAQHQGLTPESVVDKVKNVAKEATNTAKEEAKRQNLTPEAALNAMKPDQPAQPGQPQGQPGQPKPQQAAQPQGQTPGQPQGQQAKPAPQGQPAQPASQAAAKPPVPQPVPQPELVKK